MSDGSDPTSQKYFESLNAQPIEQLSESDIAELLGWLKRQGRTEEYDVLQRVVQTRKPKSLLKPRQDEQLIHTTQTVSSSLGVEGSSLEDLSADTETGPMSTEELLLLDPRAETLQPLLHLPPTKKHRLQDTAPIHARHDDFDSDPEETQSVDLVDSGQRDVIPQPFVTPPDRAYTPAIKRTKLVPKVIDRRNEVPNASAPPKIPQQELEDIANRSEDKPRDVRSEDEPEFLVDAGSSRLSDRVKTTTHKSVPSFASEPSELSDLPTLDARSARQQSEHVLPTHRGKPETSIPKDTDLVRRPRNALFWTVAIICLLSGLLLVDDYRSAAANADARRQSHTQVFRTGNYRTISELLTRLESQEVSESPIRVLSNALLPLIGVASPHDKIRRIDIASELRFRSSLGFVFQDFEILQPLPELIAKAESLNLQTTDVAAAQILANLVLKENDNSADLEAVLSAANSTAHSDWVRALLASSKGRMDKANKLFRSAVTLDFEHPYAAIYLARLLEARGDQVAALKLLDQISMTRPEAVFVRIESARLGIGRAERYSHARRELLTLKEEPTLARVEQSLVALSLAEMEQRAGKPEEAKSFLKQALSKSVRPDEALEKLVRLHLALGEVVEAERCLTQTERVSSDTQRRLWAQIHLSRGEPIRALQELERLSEGAEMKNALTDQAVALQLLLSLSNEKSLGLKAALRAAKDRLNGLHVIEEMTASQLLIYAFLNVDDSQTLAIVRRRMQNRDNQPDHVFLNWSLVLSELRMQRGEFERASRLLNSAALREHPTGLLAWMHCRLEFARFKVSAGIAQCKSAIRRAQFRPARQLLSRVLELRGSYSEAMTLLSRWPDDQQADPADQYRLLRALYHMGESSKLQSSGARHAQSGAEQLSSFAAGLTDILSERNEDGLGRLRRIANVRNDDAMTLTLLGDIFAAANRPREAQGYFERAIALTDEPFPRLGLARLLLEHGQIDEAYDQAMNAIQLSKSSLSAPIIRSNALAVKARVLIRRGGRRNMRKASRVLKKALKVQADSGEALIAKALHAEKEGKKQTARRIYKGLAEDPDFRSEARYRLGRLLMSERMTRREGRVVLNNLLESDADFHWRMRARQLLR